MIDIFSLTFVQVVAHIVQQQEQEQISVHKQEW